MPTGPTEGPQVWRRHRKGRPAPSPHDWPLPSAHLPWVLLGLCGNSCFVALGAQDSSPVPPPGPSPRACLLPGALLAFVTEQGTGSQTWGCQPSAGAPVPGVPCPAFALASPTRGPAVPVQLGAGGAVGAPHTLPTSPSSQPLPHFRGFSDAGSHAPCCPQLEVGRPALKLTASPKGPLQGGVGEP